MIRKVIRVIRLHGVILPFLWPVYGHRRIPKVTPPPPPPPKKKRRLPGIAFTFTVLLEPERKAPPPRPQPSSRIGATSRNTFSDLGW